MNINKTETFYTTSHGAFQQKCYYRWHRRFDAANQKRALAESNACLATYISEHPAMFGQESTVVEQTVMKLELELTNSSRDDIDCLVTLLRIFEPAGYTVEFRDDTYEDAEAVLIMWWHTRRLPIESKTVERNEQTHCIKVHEDELRGLEKVVNEFGSASVHVYGEGPWLVTDSPLTPEHAKLLLDVKS